MNEGAASRSKASQAGPRQELEPPSRFRVLLHNDHYTTMDFVIFILESVFQKAHSEAVRIMLNVHRNGAGICGVFCAEVAETKVKAVHKLAKNNGFPLMCSMEPE